MLGVTFRQLEVFVEAVDVGGFRACAERLGITQVSVSGHIRSMERMIGCELFTRRSGSTSELTEDGERVYRHASVLLDEMRHLMADVGRPGGVKQRRRLIVSTPSFVSYRLSPVLAEFSLQHPEWRLEIETNDVESAEEVIRRGQADLAFALALEGSPPAGADRVWSERVAIYVGNHHPLANRPVVSASELADYPAIILPRRHNLRTILEYAMAQVGIEHNPVALQTTSTRVAQRALSGSNAFACMFSGKDWRTSNDGELVELPLDTPLPAIEIWLLSTGSAPMRRAARSLMELVAGET